MNRDSRLPSEHGAPVDIRDRCRSDPLTRRPGQPAGPAVPSNRPTGEPETALLRRTHPEVASLRRENVELTLELQRLKAEYDHYRQRVRRDRLAVREIAVVTVLTGLLPVLDAVEGAREHGDGVPRPVADMLEERLTALGLQSVGAPEQPFDPTVHEALTFHPSDQATQAVCTQVLRRGYRVGEHLLRPALVSVTGPGSQAAGSQVMAARQDAEQEQPMGRPHSLPLTRASAHTRDRLGARPDIGHERQRKGVSHNPCQEGCNGTVQKSGLRLW